MKNRMKYYGPTVAFGLLGLALRAHMLATGIDDKGLLTRGNWNNIALWVLTAVFAVFMWVRTRGLEDGGNYRTNFPQCKLSGGLAMAGGGILVLMVPLGQASGNPLGMVLGLLAGIAMIFTGYCRFKGQHPMFLAHGVVSLFFLVALVGRYQRWSPDPQLYEYGLQMLCGAVLMLCAYNRTRCDISRISRRNLVFFGMVSCYLCLICLSDATAPGFYLAAGLWAGGSMCTVDSVK